MLNVSIVTPNGVVLEDEFYSVVAQGDNGQIGILPNHVPIMMKISKGFVRLRKDDHVVYVSIYNGVLEQSKNKVTILAQDGHTGATYEEAEEKRLARLKSRDDENKRLLVDFVGAENELIKSIKEARQYKI